MSIRADMMQVYDCALCGARYSFESSALNCSRRHELHAALVTLRAAHEFDSMEYLVARGRLASEMLRCAPLTETRPRAMIWPAAVCDEDPTQADEQTLARLRSLAADWRSRYR